MSQQQNTDQPIYLVIQPGSELYDLFLRIARQHHAQLAEATQDTREIAVSRWEGVPFDDFFGIRIRNILWRGGILTFGDLLQKSSDDLLALPSFGRHSLRAVKRILAGIDLTLRMSAPEIKLLSELVEELDLGVRAYNMLKQAGIQTIGDLTGKSSAELKAIPNFGKKQVDEVIKTLASRGLHLRED